MTAPCCSVGARLDAEALAALDQALLAAREKRPGAESLNAIAKRTHIRKENLIRHRDTCLAKDSAAVRGGPDRGGPSPKQPRKHDGPRGGPRPSRFAAKNPGDDPVTAPRKVIAATIEQKCVDLRAKGKSYAEIADALGIAEDTAQDMVERVLIRTRRGTDAKADAARRLDLLRIDKMLASLWDRATDSSMATVDVPADNEKGIRAYDGQDKAIDRVTKLLERRAKLLGLDAAEKVSVTLLDKAEESPDFTELFRVMRRMLDARFPGATAFLTEGLDHYRVRGEPGVDAFLAGDMALPVLVEDAGLTETARHDVEEQHGDAVDGA